MISITKQFVLTIAFLVATAHSGIALSQEKVVVIPLGADSATPNVDFVAFGTVRDNSGSPTFSKLSTPPGVNASVSSSSTGSYTISLSGYQRTLNPVILVTPITTVFGDPASCVAKGPNATSSTPGSFSTQVECFTEGFLIYESFYWMIMD